MAEYLSPGVYVEETSFRAKSIEGVATSTTGFVGQCAFGPIDGIPQLVTSFADFERHFGGLEPLFLGGSETENYLAHAVRLFFDNGGTRLYIARVFNAGGRSLADLHAASATNMASNRASYRARFPGRAGNVIVDTEGIRSGNLLAAGTSSVANRGLRAGDVVEVGSGPAFPKTRLVGDTAADLLEPASLRFVRFDSQGRPELVDEAGTVLDLTTVTSVQRLTLNVRVRTPMGGRSDAYQGMSAHPDSDLFIGRVLRHEDPAAGIEPPVDRSARVRLAISVVLPSTVAGRNQFANELLVDLLAAAGRTQPLINGGDGNLATAGTLEGTVVGDIPSGLRALERVEDIAIVAAPGCATLATADDRQAARNALILHCERLRYRFAILSAESNLDTAQIREVRSKHDSTYAALYYPWVVVQDPFGAQGAGRSTLLLPPDGAIAGIYGRSDVARGVHKAPANEVVRGVLRFSRDLDKGNQDALNPEGINCLRFFEGRGYRVWGARTITSDPEWIYLNVRRLFIFLEHSIDRGTQWAVFEPNNEELWLKVRLTIESFMTDVWRTGALMGTRPEEAFFVRCDRSTMTQGDLDNGRLVCLIGVCPTKPAEFVIFRIGQWTADASLV